MKMGRCRKEVGSQMRECNNRQTRRTKDVSSALEEEGEAVTFQNRCMSDSGRLGTHGVCAFIHAVRSVARVTSSKNAVDPGAKSLGQNRPVSWHDEQRGR